MLFAAVVTIVFFLLLVIHFWVRLESLIYWMMGFNSLLCSAPAFPTASLWVDSVFPHLGLTLDSNDSCWLACVRVHVDSEPVWSPELTSLHLCCWFSDTSWKEHAAASLLLQVTGEIRGAHSDLMTYGVIKGQQPESELSSCPTESWGK